MVFNCFNRYIELLRYFCICKILEAAQFEYRLALRRKRFNGFVDLRLQFLSYELFGARTYGWIGGVTIIIVMGLLNAVVLNAVQASIMHSLIEV